ncbi:MAG: thiamine phosphate synthase [Opitutaceae bacterium]|nr:thiamine phosphate synthase [Opitutaceae bacterium]
MKLVVISPEHDDPRETAVLGALFAAGLERYHVRKPHWSAGRLAVWLRALPRAWYPRLVLHQHHELVAEFGLGGCHWRDDVNVGRDRPPSPRLCSAGPIPPRIRKSAGFGDPALQRGVFTSRSCHGLVTLKAALGRYDSVFFGPVFPSISKPGHGPRTDFMPEELTALLGQRTAAERKTAVLALGGVTAKNLPRCRDLGFDGAAVLGAVWQAPDPVAVFRNLQAVGAKACCAPMDAMVQP